MFLGEFGIKVQNYVDRFNIVILYVYVINCEIYRMFNFEMLV